MKWFYVFVIGLGVLGAQEWWQQRVPHPRIAVAPGWAAVQDIGHQAHLFGAAEGFLNWRPFGYFFDNFSILDTGFSLQNIGPERLLFFGDKKITGHEPIDFRSDIWVVKNTLPPDFILPPQEIIIWLHPTKRVPKKLKDLAITHQIPLLVPKDMGRFYLHYRDSQWQL